jgi:hypothetical protein
MNPARAFPPPHVCATEHTRHGGNWSCAHPRRPFLFQSGGHGFASFPVTPARVAQIGASRMAAKSLSPLLCAIYDLLTIGNSCKRISVYSVHG